MLKTTFLISLQNTLDLTELQLTKAYEADWLPGGQSVMRDNSGKFTSKSGGSSSSPKVSNDEKFRLALVDELDKSFKEVDRLSDEYDKLSPKDQKDIKDAILSPDGKKTRQDLTSPPIENRGILN